MNSKVFTILIIMGLFSSLSEKLASAQTPKPVSKSIYDFTATSLDGQEIDFSKYKGRYILIVNTASKCGFTPQYKDLQNLHVQYQHKLVVLGFPANNFLWQEPGSNKQIEKFCSENYGVSFQMFEKISVKGKDKHPIYQWLEAKTGRNPSWNFCKYLIDKNGEVVTFYSSNVNPLDKEIIDKINP